MDYNGLIFCVFTELRRVNIRISRKQLSIKKYLKCVNFLTSMNGKMDPGKTFMLPIFVLDIIFIQMPVNNNYYGQVC